MNIQFPFWCMPNSSLARPWPSPLVKKFVFWQTGTCLLQSYHTSKYVSTLNFTKSFSSLDNTSALKQYFWLFWKLLLFSYLGWKYTIFFWQNSNNTYLQYLNTGLENFYVISSVRKTVTFKRFFLLLHLLFGLQMQVRFDLKLGTNWYTFLGFF